MFERFEDAARTAVHRAQAVALEFGYNYIGTELLLLGILAEPGEPASRLLAHVGLEYGEARRVVLAVIGPGSSTVTDPDALLQTLGIDLDAIRRRVEATFGADAVYQAITKVQSGQTRRRKRPYQSPLSNARWLPFCPRVKRSIEAAARHADRRSQPISPTHLLLGTLETPKALAGQILTRRGVDVATLRQHVERTLDAAA